MAWDSEDKTDGKLRWTKRVTGTTDISETITFDRLTKVTDIALIGPTTSVWSSTFKPTSSSTGQQLADIALDNATSELYSNDGFIFHAGESLTITSTNGVSGEKELTIKAFDLQHSNNYGA